MISIHDEEALEAMRRRLRLQPDRLKDARNAFLKRSLGAAGAAGVLRQAGVPEDELAAIEWHPLQRIERQDSSLDGASKLLFATGRGERIESVILRYATGRTSVCVSSQVGCAAACSFCATGTMGLTRSLETAEILDQVVHANEVAASEGKRVRNIVFMGMGEPFHNEANVTAAVEALTSPARFDYSAARVLVSTVGVPDAMLRFAQRFDRGNLALSLHSAIQEKRLERVPMAAKASLDDLRAAVAAVNAIQRRPLMIEYLMLAGWNDGDEDLDALARWLEGLAVHVNLIPFNAIAEDAQAGTDRPRREAFGAALKARGFPVTLRYSLGRDIAAACGQLVREESARRRRALPTHTP